MKKILAIVLTLSMVFSVPVFADTTTPAQPAATETTTAAPTTPEAQPASDTTAPADTTTTAPADTTTTVPTDGTAGSTTTNTTSPAPTTTTTTTTTDATPVATGDTVVVPVDATTTPEAGVTPDSIFYSLDKLMEKIQLALVTDAVKEAELLAKIAQERLAESTEMANKADVELTQKALDEYKANLEQAVTLINTAMEQGKQVADVMESIKDANLKDAAVVEQIIASIPEEFRADVKAEIEKIAAAADAAAETAATVENKDEEQNSVKLEITMKLIEEKVQDPALLAKIKAANLNTRQIIAVISLSEQSKKPLGEVLDMFVANEKGIGATAHELGLNTKDALKGINESFKDAKETIKAAFKAAIKSVDEEDQAEVEAIVNNSLASPDTTATVATTEVKATNEKLQKVVADAKAQVAAIEATSKDKKNVKAAEKSANGIEKAQQNIQKSAEKATEKVEKATDKTNEVKGQSVNNVKENQGKTKNK